MVAPKLQPVSPPEESKLANKLNRQLDTSNCDSTVLSSLIAYMEIMEDDNKPAIEKRLIQKAEEAKSVKRLLKKELKSPKATEGKGTLEEPAKVEGESPPQE